MNKEEMKATAKKLLELKEPVLVPMLADKLAKYASLIYFIGLFLLAVSLLTSFVSMFTANVSIGLFGFVMVAVEYVVLRMVCEFLLSCGSQN